MFRLQRYLRFISVADILLFFVVIIACTVTEKYVCKLQPFPLPLLSNGTEEFQAQNTIWDYRVMLLSKVQKYGPEAYHSVYLLIILIAVLYGVMEIWLFCVLTKAVNQKRPEFCSKWMAWRIFFLVITLGASGYHIMSQLQMTCTEAIVVPFSICRIISVLFVWTFWRKIRCSCSINDSIIMTGSEKI